MKPVARGWVAVASALVVGGACGGSDQPSATSEPDIVNTPGLQDLRLADLPTPAGFELTYAERPELPPLGGVDHFVTIFTKEGARWPDRPWIEIKVLLFGTEDGPQGFLTDLDFEASGWTTPGGGVALGDFVLTNRPTPTTFGVVFVRNNFLVFGTAHKAVDDESPEITESEVYDLLRQVDARMVEVISQ